MDKGQRFHFRLSLALAALLAAASPAAVSQASGVDDLLPLSKAFRLEISRPRADQLRVRWTIADGYYLYRHRIRFEAAPAKLLGELALPPGIPKQDPFFGETEIYRHQVAVMLPLQSSAATLEQVSLRVISQGCADIGICFPPEARDVRLAVGETAVPPAADPFAPIGVKADSELLIPSSPLRSDPPDSGLSP